MEIDEELISKSPTEADRRGKSVEEMHSRRELMADGRRYIIYYIFSKDAADEGVIAGGPASDV